MVLVEPVGLIHAVYVVVAGLGLELQRISIYVSRHGNL